MDLVIWECGVVSNTFNLSLFIYLSLSLSLFLSFSLTLSHPLSPSFSFSISLTFSHPRSVSLSLSHTQTHTYTDTHTHTRLSQPHLLCLFGGLIFGSWKKIFCIKCIISSHLFFSHLIFKLNKTSFKFLSLVDVMTPWRRGCSLHLKINFNFLLSKICENICHQFLQYFILK